MTGDVVAIELVPGRILRLDRADLPLLNGTRWRVWVKRTAQGREYAYVIPQKAENGPALHRRIVQAKPGQIVDHIDGDGLNNARANLRVCTHAENMRNRRINAGHRVGVKGVQRRPSGKFYAQIRAGAVRRFKGGFETAEAAGTWYAAQARELHGRFTPGALAT